MLKKLAKGKACMHSTIQAPPPLCGLIFCLKLQMSLAVAKDWSKGLNIILINLLKFVFV